MANNKDRAKLQQIDPVHRLEILIDGDTELGVRGLRDRMDRVEKLLIGLVLISTVTAVGTWVTGSDELAGLLPLLLQTFGG